MCQADGIGALNADSNSFSRVVNLDFDKIIIERNAELLSDHQTGELQFFRHFLSLPPLDGVIVHALAFYGNIRSSLGQHAALDAFKFSSQHGISEPPYSEAIGYTIYSEDIERAHRGLIAC